METISDYIQVDQPSIQDQQPSTQEDQPSTQEDQPSTPLQLPNIVPFTSLSETPAKPIPTSAVKRHIEELYEQLKLLKKLLSLEDNYRYATKLDDLMTNINKTNQMIQHYTDKYDL
jgi:hypothetical protein